MGFVTLKSAALTFHRQPTMFKAWYSVQICLTSATYIFPIRCSISLCVMFVGVYAATSFLYPPTHRRVTNGSAGRVTSVSLHLLLVVTKTRALSLLNG